MRQPAVLLGLALLVAGLTWIDFGRRTSESFRLGARTETVSRAPAPSFPSPGAEIRPKAAAVPSTAPRPAIRSRFDAMHRPAADDRSFIAFRREAEELFGPAIDAMALAPDIVPRLTELLAERSQAASDARQIAVAGETPVTRVDLAVQEATGQVDAEIRNLVGEPTFNDLSFIMSSQAYRDVRNSFLLDARFAGVPLNGRQLIQVTKLLDAEAGRAPGEGAPDPASVRDRADDRIFNQAQTFLGAEQCALLRDYLLLRRE